MRRLLIEVLLIFCLMLTSLAAGPPPTPAAPPGVNSLGIIAAGSEPGERLIFNGQVFAPDGETPAADVIVYAYQTDSTGHYQNDAGCPSSRLGQDGCTGSF